MHSLSWRHSPYGVEGDGYDVRADQGLCSAGLRAEAVDFLARWQRSKPVTISAYNAVLKALWEQKPRS